MTIAIYSFAILEQGGGLENSFIDTAINISKYTDHRVFIITNNKRYTSILGILLGFYRLRPFKKIDFERESKESIKKRLGNIQYVNASSFKHLRKILKEADIIYSKNELLESFIFKYILKYKRVPPVVYYCATAGYYSDSNTVEKKLHNLLYNGFAYRHLASGVCGFQVINSLDKHRLTKLFPRKIVRLIPNPIGSNFVDVQVKNSNHNNSRVFNIAWVGRLTEQKGVSKLEELIDLLNKETLTKVIQWNIAGDGELRQEVIKIQSNNHNVKYFGHIENAAVPEFLIKNDLFVSTSLWETFGLNILEALTVGLPAIAFNISGPKDIINKNNGILVNNVNEMAKAIIDVIKGKVIFNDISSGTMKVYNPKSLTQTLQAFFQEVIDE